MNNSNVWMKINEINELCGAVNFSSHNQMREAIEGAMEICETLLSEQPIIEVSVELNALIQRNKELEADNKKYVDIASAFSKAGVELIRLRKEKEEWLSKQSVIVQSEDVGMPKKEDFTFNGELMQPHYHNAMKCWEKLKKQQSVTGSEDVEKAAEKYVFTLEKLEAIKKGSYNNGWSDCLKKYDPKGKQKSTPISEQSVVEFIEWIKTNPVKFDYSCLSLETQRNNVYEIVKELYAKFKSESTPFNVGEDGLIKKLENRKLNIQKMPDNYIRHKAEGFNNGLTEAMRLIRNEK
jgi:hypothetical protein